MYSSKVVIVTSAISFGLLFFILGIQNLIFSPKFIPDDAYSYIESANLLWDNFNPHPTRPLLFAFIIGLIHLIYENPTVNQYLLFSLFINFFSWITVVLILYKTLLLLINKKASFWLTIVFVSSLGSIAINTTLLTEPITTLMLSIIIFYLFKFNIKKKYTFLIRAISALNLLPLIRPGFFYVSLLSSFALLSTLAFCTILVIFPGITYIVNSRLGGFLKQLLPSNSTISGYFNFFRGHYGAMLMFVFSLGLLSLQHITMYKTYGKATISFIDKLAWYRYLGAESAAESAGISTHQEVAIRDSIIGQESYLTMSEISSKDFKAQLTNNKLNIIKSFFKNLITNTIGGSSVIYTIYNIYDTNSTSNTKIEQPVNDSKFLSISNIANTMFYITKLQNLMYITSLIIVMYFFIINVSKANLPILFSLLVVLYVVLTSGIAFWQGDRFHIILYPTIIILFANAVSNSCYEKYISENEQDEYFSKKI